MPVVFVKQKFSSSCETVVEDHSEAKGTGTMQIHSFL